MGFEPHREKREVHGVRRFPVETESCRRRMRKMVPKVDIRVCKDHDRCPRLSSAAEDDDFKKLLRVIWDDPFMNDFQKKQLVKAVTTEPEPGMNEDEFLLKFSPHIRIFLIEHFPYPIPKYLRKLSDYR